MSNGSFDMRLLSGIGVLSAVVRAGNFLRAAQAIGLTQPAVSRAVSRLEQRIGIRLFHRSSRSVALTDEGRRFYDAIAPLLSGIEAAATSAQASMNTVNGLLRVSVDRMFAEYVLTPSIASFLAGHPDLKLEIVVQERFGDLVADGFDFAIHSGEPRSSSLQCERLMEVPVVTCASPGYLADRGIPEHPHELGSSHECVLMRNPATGQPFAWEFTRSNEVVSIEARGRLTVNEPGSLVGACLGGQGIGQPLEFYVRHHIEHGRLIRLLPDWSEETFPVHIYHHDASLMPERVKVFWHHLLNIASK